MSMNKTAETSTSVGTGDFVLNGAWNIPGTFNTGNRTLFASLKKINHFFPYYIQDMLGNWEKGYGYLSSPTVMVRYSVADTSVAVGDRTKINFGAGEKIVMIGSEARGVGAAAVNTMNFVMSPHNVGIKSGNLTVAVNRLYLTPYVFDTPTRITAMGHYIRNTVGGATCRFGIFNANKQLSERPGAAAYDTFFKLLSDVGVIDVSTPGLKSISCDEVVGKGVYLVATVFSGAVSVMANTTNNIDVGLSWNNYEGNALSFYYHDSASHINGLPAETFGAILGVMNSGGPAMLIKGDCL